MRRLIILFTGLFIFSCDTNNTPAGTEKDSAYLVEPKVNEQDTSSARSATAANNWTGCYWRIVQRDTFVLHLQQNNGNISGRLTFNNFQKDKSAGTVYGNIDGDIVRLWYSFSSEGMNSIMEVYFKKQGDGLVRGLGDVAVKGDTSYFPNREHISYSNDQRFTRVNCSEVPGKYL